MIGDKIRNALDISVMDSFDEERNAATAELNEMVASMFKMREALSAALSNDLEWWKKAEEALG